MYDIEAFSLVLTQLTQQFNFKMYILWELNVVGAFAVQIFCPHILHLMRATNVLLVVCLPPASWLLTMNAFSLLLSFCV